MKYHFVLAAAASLALCACGKSEAPSAQPSASPTVAVAEPSVQPSIAATDSGTPDFTVGEAPSKAFMAGTWGVGDACEMPINFQADGTIKDGPFERWDVRDGQLIMEGAPQKLKLTIVDARTMKSQIEGDAQVRTLKRC